MNNIDKLTELNYYFLKLREILLQEDEHNYSQFKIKVLCLGQRS